MEKENEKDEKDLTAAELLKLEKKQKSFEDRENRENERLKAQLFEQQREMEILEKKLKYAQEEKRKPGITVVDEEGNTLKKKRVNSLGVSDKCLPPYTKNQIAIYRILDQGGINPATGERVLPVDTIIPGRYLFHDIWEPDPLKKDKILLNIKGAGMKKEDGRDVLVDEVDDITFHRGFIQVNVQKHYRLYCFLELHPMNKSNKLRPRNAFSVFERTDIKRSDVSLDAELDLAIDAANKIREMNKEDILAYCAAIPELAMKTSNTPIHQLRTDFTRIVMKDPITFYKLSKDDKASIQINLVTALDFGLIEYNPSFKSYVWSETEEKLFTHTPAEKPLDAFVAFLMKEDNADIYRLITDKLKWWE